MEFASKIYKINHCVDFSITSWIRSPERNHAVGGAEKSLHLKGLAVDVVLDHPNDIKYFLRRLDDMNLEYRNEGDHVHIQAKRKSD